ncbi:MAG TPA: ABC transporter permease, partial [Acidimicrobiia bacterium]
MANDTLFATAPEDELREREIAGLDALAAALPSGTSRVRRLWSGLWPPVLAAVLFVLAWQVVVWTHWKPQELLPSPFTVFKSMKGHLGTLWTASVTTLYRGVKGFA